MGSTTLLDQTPLETAQLVWHGFSDLDTWRWASAVAIAAELRRDLQHRARGRLLLSGGAIVRPVYRALSKAPLEWDRIDVALVDERWLMPDDPDSNAHLVRTELLTHHAARARFEAMTQPGRAIEQAVAIANAHGRQPASIAVLAMGDDGHVASLFPHMPRLPLALASTQPYLSVDATGCAGAQRWLRRISLTPAGLRMSNSRLLLIRGANQRAVLEQARASGDVARWPVLAALDGHHERPLHVYWCP